MIFQFQKESPCKSFHMKMRSDGFSKKKPGHFHMNDFARSFVLTQRTPSKLKCGIPIWENSEEYWYLLLKKFVFPKVLAKWKKKKKCSVEFSKDDATSLTKTYNSCKKDRQSRIPF